MVLSLSNDKCSEESGPTDTLIAGVERHNVPTRDPRLEWLPSFSPPRQNDRDVPKRRAALAEPVSERKRERSCCGSCGLCAHLWSRIFDIVQCLVDSQAKDCKIQTVNASYQLCNPAGSRAEHRQGRSQGIAPCGPQGSTTVQGQSEAGPSRETASRTAAPFSACACFPTLVLFKLRFVIACLLVYKKIVFRNECF